MNTAAGEIEFQGLRFSKAFKFLCYLSQQVPEERIEVFLLLQEEEKMVLECVHIMQCSLANTWTQETILQEPSQHGM